MRGLLTYAVLVLLTGRLRGQCAREKTPEHARRNCSIRRPLIWPWFRWNCIICDVEIPQSFIDGHFKYTDRFDIFSAAARDIFINRLIAGINAPAEACSKENSRKALAAYRIEMLKLRKASPPTRWNSCRKRDRDAKSPRRTTTRRRARRPRTDPDAVLGRELPGAG